MVKVNLKRIQELLAGEKGKSWLFTQNNTVEGRKSFQPDPEVPNRFWNGDWAGLPKKTDYIAHWLVEERCLYVGKASLMPPVAVPKDNSSAKQRYKLCLDHVVIYQVDANEVAGSFVRNLLNRDPGNVYSYWPDGINESLESWDRNKKTGLVSAPRDQLEVLNDNFVAKVSDAMRLSESELEQKARKHSAVPEKTEVKTSVFKRNPYVVAIALNRAKGICECCGEDAPFIRASGTPYLEVHHIHKLAEGGVDTPENTEALCPNCHREKHFGFVD